MECSEQVETDKVTEKLSAMPRNVSPKLPFNFSHRSRGRLRLAPNAFAKTSIHHHNNDNAPGPVFGVYGNHWPDM